MRIAVLFPLLFFNAILFAGESPMPSGLPSLNLHPPSAEQSEEDVRVAEILIEHSPSHAGAIVRILIENRHPKAEDIYSRYVKAHPTGGVLLPNEIATKQSGLPYRKAEAFEDMQVLNRAASRAYNKARDILEDAEKKQRQTERDAEAESRLQQQLLADAEKREAAQKNPGKAKIDTCMAVKRDVEREGRFFLTADISSLDDIRRFDYIISYKVHPRSVNQVYADMEAVFVLTAQLLEKHGYNHNRDGIKLRARAFMPQGSTQNADGITFNMLRFGKGHWDLNAGRIAYNENWWDWTDGE